MTGHFKNLSPDLEPRLKKAAEAIKPTKQFQPFKFIQAMFNQKYHPEAITEVMEYLASPGFFMSSIEKPWAYAHTAVKSKSHTYYERDDIKRGQLDKKEFNTWIEALGDMIKKKGV